VAVVVIDALLPKVLFGAWRFLSFRLFPTTVVPRAAMEVASSLATSRCPNDHTRKKGMRET